MVAAPHLGDPNFVRTVVFVAEHSEQGGFGLVINRPSGLAVSKLWQAIGGEPITCPWKTFIGGPVEKSAVFLLHSFPDLAGESEPILPGVWLGQDRELFAALIERARGEEDPATLPFRAYCGYAGWGAGQLDSELETGSWLVQPATAESIFTRDAEGLWNRALERQGGVYSLFSRMPQDPELN